MKKITPVVLSIAFPLLIAVLDSGAGSYESFYESRIRKPLIGNNGATVVLGLFFYLMTPSFIMIYLTNLEKKRKIILSCLLATIIFGLSIATMLFFGTTYKGITII